MTLEQINQFNQIQQAYPTSFLWLEGSLCIAIVLMVTGLLFTFLVDHLSATDVEKYVKLKRFFRVVYGYTGRDTIKALVILRIFFYVFLVVMGGVLFTFISDTSQEAKAIKWEQNRAQFLLQLPREHYELVGDSPTPDGKISVLYKDKGTVYSSNIPTSSFLFDAKTEPYVSATWVPLQEGVPIHGIPEDLITSKDGKYGFWVNVELHYLGGDGESDAE